MRIGTKRKVGLEKKVMTEIWLFVNFSVSFYSISILLKEEKILRKEERDGLVRVYAYSGTIIQSWKASHTELELCQT